MILTALLGSAGVTVGTGRVSLARQVKGDDPDKKGYAPGWGLGVGLTTPPYKKSVLVKSLQQLETGCEDDFGIG
jgi:hypothetical protein